MSEEPQSFRDPADFTPARAALWMLGALIVMLSGALLWLGLNPGAEKDQVGLGAVSAAAFLFVSALLVGAYPAGPKVSQALALRASHPAALPLALAIGALAQLPAERLSSWIDRLKPLSNEELASRSQMFAVESDIQAGALIVVLCCLVPFAEEAFFRGAVYGALRRAGSTRFVAGVVVALGFVFCHMNLRLFVPLALVAVILGLLRSSSGSLLPGVIAHAAFNGFTVVGQLAGWEFPELSLVGEAALLALLVGLLLFFIRLVSHDLRVQTSLSLETRIQGVGEAGHEVAR